MNVSIIALEHFRKEAKRLIKKYPSLKTELRNLESDLSKNPFMGTLIREKTYKIRLGVKSKGKGKSGGLRIITYIEIELEFQPQPHTKVYLLSIYDKSEYENINEKDLSNLIGEANEEAN
jgi:mRNA-degrading endonuclease RelE of RelBE toxin-antitoxin system